MNKYIPYYLTCLLILLGTISWAQVCSCPPTSECKPCSGGYTSITLRYNGNSPALVLVKDGLNVLANLTIRPYEEFTISGSKKNEKFVDKLVPVLVNGLPDTMLGALCSDLNVGVTYGSFTIIAAVSINGTSVCCTTPPPDVVPPLLQNIPGTIDAPVIVECGSTVSWTDPIASDNCQVKSITSSHKPGDFFSLGTTTVTYTAIDEAGLTTIASFDVIVTDQTPPVITNLPNDINALVGNSCSTQVSWIEPIASDNCSVKSITSSHKPGDVFPIGTTTVNYLATDEAGNVSSASFHVIVSDLSAPTFISTPADIVVPANDACGAKITWIEPEITDDCSAVVTRSHSPNDRFEIGTTIVQYQAKDLAGNTSNVSFKVTVEDREAPVFNSFPANITTILQSECSSNIAWTVPSVTDKCSEVTLTATHQPNQEFPVGITKVTYTAKDNSGNAVTKDFFVTVIDERKLEFSKCPSSIVVMLEEERSTNITWVDPTATSVCEPVLLQSNYKPGDLFPMGLTEVEYTASTNSGKKAYCNFSVHIKIVEKPLQITKLITPDGDGNNDEWVLTNINEYRDNKVQVFDRWGGLVYEGTRYDNESVVWRGTNRSGASVPTGTYFYLIVASNGKKRIQETGSVELVR